MTENAGAFPVPTNLFNAFMACVANPSGNLTNANCSHLMDGVAHLAVRIYDPNGFQLTNHFYYYSNGGTNSVQNVLFNPPSNGQIGFYMFSNALPAAVEVEMATFEDRTLQRASIWPNGSVLQSNYLASAAGKVHVFRQRVTIPQLDTSVYQ